VAALAVDLDRTLVYPGHRPPQIAVRALGEARAMGLKVILVSGRPHVALEPFLAVLGTVDAVVAENGAVVEAPRGRRPSVVGVSVGTRVRLRLAREPQIPVEFGEIVASVRQEDLRRAARLLRGLPVTFVRNVDRVMVLPKGVTKSFGVRTALRQMRLPGLPFAAIGDGENDLPMLRDAALSAAVANGTPAARSAAGYLCRGSGARGVAEFVRGPLARWQSTVPAPRPAPRAR
jgi:hydroxymethylpyrimidine pyrophosphatase-like HAD family hydrolase